jgi:hypothetical protein
VRAKKNQFGENMMMPHNTTKRIATTTSVMLTLFLLTGATFGKHKGPGEPPFQYLAGTEDISKGCAGRLQVLKEALTFTCPAGRIQMPFAAITLMQYRPDVSRDVMNMNIPWKIKPQLARVRQNKYFTVVCNEQGKLRAVILLVNEDDMRPYFAEIELRSGKSVQEYRSFDEFD